MDQEPHQDRASCHFYSQLMRAIRNNPLEIQVALGKRRSLRLCVSRITGDRPSAAACRHALRASEPLSKSDQAATGFRATGPMQAQCSARDVISHREPPRGYFCNQRSDEASSSWRRQSCIAHPSRRREAAIADGRESSGNLLGLRHSEAWIECG